MRAVLGWPEGFFSDISAAPDWNEFVRVFARRSRLIGWFNDAVSRRYTSCAKDHGQFLRLHAEILHHLLSWFGVYSPAFGSVALYSNLSGSNALSDLCLFSEVPFVSLLFLYLLYCCSSFVFICKMCHKRSFYFQVCHLRDTSPLQCHFTTRTSWRESG